MTPIKKPPTIVHAAGWPSGSDREAGTTAEAEVNGTVKIEKWTITRAGNTTRISGPTTTAKKRESLRRQARAMLGEKRRYAPVDWTEVDEVLAKVQTLKPVGDPTLNSAVTSDWQDANRDRWGRPKNGNAARWGAPPGGLGLERSGGTGGRLTRSSARSRCRTRRS